MVDSKNSLKINQSNINLDRIIVGTGSKKKSYKAVVFTEKDVQKITEQIRALENEEFGNTSDYPSGNYYPRNEFYNNLVKTVLFLGLIIYVVILVAS